VNISQLFSVQPNVKFSYANSNAHSQGYTTFLNPLTSALLKPSIMAPYEKNSLDGSDLPDLDDVGVFDISNPKSVVDNVVGEDVNYNFLSSMKANFKFSDHFLVSTLVGLEYGNDHQNFSWPSNGIASDDTSYYNSASYFVNEFQSYQNHTNLSYNTSVKGHSIIINAGYRVMKNTYKYDSATDYNSATDEYDNIGDGEYSTIGSVDGDERESVWVSSYAGINYNFKNKYFLETNFSYDGSSALDGDNRYNLYPSVAAGWQVIPEVKLRGSYSLTGNMFSSVYDYADLYYVNAAYGESGVMVREGISNPDMEIEKKSTYNIGLDLTLLRKRLNINVDAYQSDVNNLLMDQSLDEIWGYTDYVDNGGHLQMQGLEVNLNTRINFGKVLWLLDVTAAMQKSEIKELDYISTDVDKTLTEIVGGTMVTMVGEAPNVFYGYETDGVYATEEEAELVTGPNGFAMEQSDVKFVDNYSEGDGENVINSDDKVVIGDPNPDLFGGVYTAFKYDKWQLSAQINYSIGNDAFNYVRYLMESKTGYSNQYTSVNGSDIPTYSYEDTRGNNVFSDRWIEDASFVRVKNITLSYEMPSFKGFRSWTVYATATNLITFTDYSGFDPEFMYDNNIFTRGVDYGQMPQSRKFVLGIKLDL
jgi:hypothetical protein